MISGEDEQVFIIGQANYAIFVDISSDVKKIKKVIIIKIRHWLSLRGEEDERLDENAQWARSLWNTDNIVLLCSG